MVVRPMRVPTSPKMMVQKVSSVIAWEDANRGRNLVVELPLPPRLCRSYAGNAREAAQSICERTHTRRRYGLCCDLVRMVALLLWPGGTVAFLPVQQ